MISEAHAQVWVGVQNLRRGFKNFRFRENFERNRDAGRKRIFVIYVAAVQAYFAYLLDYFCSRNFSVISATATNGNLGVRRRSEFSM